MSFFIVADNIFESKWCMEELASAVKHNVNIILVTKEGSRWPNAKGERVCDFPPYDLIAELPKAVRPAFTKKSIAHSDEYYAAFCDTLVARLVRPANNATAGGGGGVGGVSIPRGCARPGSLSQGLESSAGCSGYVGLRCARTAAHPQRRQSGPLVSTHR